MSSEARHLPAGRQVSLCGRMTTPDDVTRNAAILPFYAASYKIVILFNLVR
jgi:hypothetical protein